MNVAEYHASSAPVSLGSFFTSQESTPVLLELDLQLLNFFLSELLAPADLFIEVLPFVGGATQTIVPDPIDCVAPLPGGGPSVEFLYPPLGQAVARHQGVRFRALDASFRRCIVKVTFPGRPDLGWVFAHDGDGFGPDFQGPGNSRKAIVDPSPGYLYDFLMTGGWPAAPLFFVIAIDGAGLEA